MHGRLDVVLVAPGAARRPSSWPLGDHVVDRLERQVRVDRGGAEADEQRHVVDLAGVAGLDDQADPGPGPLADEVVVDRRRQQQRRDRRQLGRSSCRSERTMRLAPSAMAVGDPCADVVDGLGQRPAALGRRLAGLAGVATGKSPSMAKALKPGVSPCSLTYISLARSSWSMTGWGRTIWRHDPWVGLEQVALRADRGRQRGHQLLADGVERRVGHLGEELGEVVVEQPRAVREDGDGGVGAHRADRLGAGPGHRADDHPELLGRVAEQPLVGDDAGVLGGQHRPGRQVVQARPGPRPASRRRGARRPARP